MARAHATRDCACSESGAQQTWRAVAIARLTGAAPPEPPHPRDDRIPGERSSRPAASRRCLCHDLDRQSQRGRATAFAQRQVSDAPTPEYRFARPDVAELTSALATERNSRSKSVLAHRWLATAGLEIALGRLCDRAPRASRQVKALVPVADAARFLAVGCDHPAIRGAVIAFVTERPCRRRAWLLLMGDCRTSIGDVGEQEPTSALRAGCLRPRGSGLATEPPAARTTQLVRHRDARPC
jgi:hypothetical protein